MSVKGLSQADELQYISKLIGRIVRECPRRKPTSEDERRSQMIVKEEFEKLGLAAREHSFEFNDNLYANIALHFGLGTLGTLLGGLLPPVGLAMHSLAAGSYWAESTRRGYLLRRLFPFKPSQNIVSILPARGEPALRIVFVVHADAAFTGLLFDPAVVKRFSGDLPPRLRFIKRSMALATHTQFALAGCDLMRTMLGPLGFLTLPLRPFEAILTIPAFLAFILNMQIVLRNEIVPGANDDLSGVAALPVLARRLARKKGSFKEIEFVFVVTGCEEASLGGADALAKDMRGVWDRDRTVIIGLDGLSMGDLNYLEVEGEVVKTPIPAWLSDVLSKTAASEPKYSEVKGFEVPVGGSDVAAFLAHGWDGVCLSCVDHEIGAPRNYHVPEDTPENLDVDKVLYSIDFAERLTEAIVKRRLGA